MGKDKTVAFIDIGSNSIHLLVIKFFPGTTGMPIFHDKEMVRLGQSLYKDGRIDRATIEKCRLVTRSFVHIAKNLGAEEIISFATCAAREAPNRSELLKAIRGDDHQINVISGEEEARLINLGVTGGKGVDKRTIFIDIGGGSTEVSISQGREILYLDSLRMGSVRYAYSFPFEQSGPISESEYGSYQREVLLHSYRSAKAVKDIGFERAVGSSGTMMALADMCAARRGDNNNLYFTLAELRSLMEDLRKTDAEAKMSFPGLSPNRIDIITPGGAIAEELMAIFGIERIEISDLGLKEGMYVDYLMEHGMGDIDEKESSVLALAKRCGYDKVHTDCVTENAMAIFDGLREAGVHNMDERWRDRLRYASILHDIGELFGFSKHRIYSYMLIKSTGLPGLAIEDIDSIALMARFHYKKMPLPTNGMFSIFSKDDLRSMMMSTVILRYADVMDRSRTCPVKSLSFTDDGINVEMKICSKEDIDMEMWRLNEMKDEFRNAFGRNIMLNLCLHRG
jgi:exopolyphosphatase/guanosine-5'-triphosphate,3'-diphosphate pyrophosphatase